MGKYIKKESYPLGKVFPHVEFLGPKNSKKNHRIDFDGDLVFMGSQRYQLFALKGVKCCVCGLEGQYFTKERSKYQDITTYHFNLYAWDKIGQVEVLITKDHIIPASSGGKDHLANFQVMCSRCNKMKGIWMPDEDTIKRINEECEMKVTTYIKKYLDKKFNVDLNN